jgi:hypothetical protein
MQRLIEDSGNKPVREFFSQSLNILSKKQHIESKFWHDKLDFMSFMIATLEESKRNSMEPREISVGFNYQQQSISIALFRNIVGNQDCTENITSPLKSFLISTNYLASLTNVSGKSRALLVYKSERRDENEPENKLSDSESMLHVIHATISLSVFNILDKCIKRINTESIQQVSKKPCLRSRLAVRDGFGIMR